MSGLIKPPDEFMANENVSVLSPAMENAFCGAGNSSSGATEEDGIPVSRIRTHYLSTPAVGSGGFFWSNPQVLVCHLQSKPDAVDGFFVQGSSPQEGPRNLIC